MTFIVISSVYTFSAKLLLFVVFCQFGMTGFVYVPRTLKKTYEKMKECTEDAHDSELPCVIL